MDRRHMLADTGDSLNMLATNIRLAYVTGRWQSLDNAHADMKMDR